MLPLSTKGVCGDAEEQAADVIKHQASCWEPCYETWLRAGRLVAIPRLAGTALGEEREGGVGTACPELALLPWAFTWLIPIPQQPQHSQELPIAQEMKGVLWEDLGMAGTQPRAAVGTSSPPAPLAIPERVFV